ncbi:MAG: hypothetical protein KAR42_09890 [candidate division Zixibacteria bacterium]|nr:hypothetical protein [candidate division Zixibacteria bacterium]
MKRLLILSIIVFGLMILIGSLSAQTDTPVIPKYDTIYKTDTLLKTDTVKTTDTVTVTDTVETSITNNSERYIKSAFELMESNKVWINIVLTAVGIFVAMFSVALAYITYQSGLARREAREETENVRAISEELVNKINKECEEIKRLKGIAVEDIKDAAKAKELWNGFVKNIKETDEETGEKLEQKGIEKSNIEEIIKLIPEEDAEKAILEYEKILIWMEIEKRPIDDIPIDVHMTMGDNYLNVENYQRAEKEYGIYRDKKPEDDEANFRLALSLVHQKKYEESLAYWKFSATEYENGYAYSNWGLALSDLFTATDEDKYLHEAIEKCKKAIEINDKNDSAYSNWGLALYHLFTATDGDKYLHEAIEKYKKATEINNKNDNAYSNWGTALSDLFTATDEDKYLHEALEKFEKATDINDKNDSAYTNWGVALDKLFTVTGEEEYLHESIKKFEKAIEINDKNDSAYSNWGVALGKLFTATNEDKYLHESIKKFEKAIEINDKNDSAYSNWGLALYHLFTATDGDKYLHEAIEKYKKATEINPKLDKAFIYLACVYSRLEDKENMLAHLKQAIELEPNNKSIAREDEDFKAYWADEDFIELTKPDEESKDS